MLNDTYSIQLQKIYLCTDTFKKVSDTDTVSNTKGLMLDFALF